MSRMGEEGRRPGCSGSGECEALFRSLGAGRAGSGVFLEQQVLPVRAVKGRNLQLIFERGKALITWEEWCEEVQFLGGVA